MQVDSKLTAEVSLIVGHSMKSTSDHRHCINSSMNWKRRAKALLDIERHDDEKFEFRKNDIVIITNQKDENFE